MFIVALFVTDKTWKQAQCLTWNEWMNKLWYILLMEYYSEKE